MRKDITIFTCDRCGKELNVSPLNEPSWIRTKFVYMKAKLNIWGTNKYKVCRQMECEFCPECADSFLRWLDGRETK